MVPYTCPEAGSTIAGAMTRSVPSSQWIGSGASESAVADMGEGRSELLSSMRATVAQNRPDAASTTFFEWVDSNIQVIADPLPDVSNFY